MDEDLSVEPVAPKKKRRKKSAELPPWTQYYRAFAYFGILSVTSSLLFGFRYAADAPWSNAFFNLLIYGLYMLPHLIMTRSWYKERFWGSEVGGPTERRVYVTVAIVGWLLVIIFQRPIPGPYFFPPNWLAYLATVGFLFFFLRSFDGVDFAKMDGLLGVPGTENYFSHGPETPLFTEGAYSQVRHPMYQAMLCMGLCSLILHPNGAQFFWLVIIGATFIGFIPVEEAQLRAARREEYDRYVEETPWRIIPGIW